MTSDLLTRRRSNGGPTELPGPIDPRLRARRIEVARHEGRKRLRKIAALAVVTAVVLGGVGASRSSLLDVDQVAVSGAGRTGADEIRAVAGIDTGRAMTSVDLGAAEARLAELPWVAEATVSRRWPGTVQVDVVERTPVAIAGEGPGAVLVDRAGRILGPANAADTARLPIAGPDPVEGPGERLPESRRAILPVLADLAPDLRAEVARGTIGPAGLGLELRDGITVRLGDRTRLRAKAEAVLVVLDQADRGTLATIDVAVPDAAAITRVPAPEPDPGVVAEQEPDADPDSSPALTGDEPGGA